jgi:DNA-binding GntR family transcriptional regulator
LPRRDVWIPTITLNRGGAVPLHRQLAQQIASAIRDGRAGSRLPSTRMLARLLGVSRNTVVDAYDALTADALIVPRRGAGVSVVERRPVGPLHRVALDRMLRDARYPSRTIGLGDPDGNRFYIVF